MVAKEFPKLQDRVRFPTTPPMFEGTFEEFHHMLLKQSNEDIKELYKYVDFLGGPDFVEILLSEVSRRKLNINYGDEVRMNLNGRDFLKNKGCI